MAQGGPVKIQFDYSLDTDNFFDSSTLEGLQRRNILELAASYYQFSDQLASITPGGGSTWSANVFHPSTLQQVTVTDRAIPADTIVIYAGGRYISVPGVLGFANPITNVTASGSSEFLDAVNTRGQAGAAAEIPTDFAPAMGSLTIFHTDAATWHFGETTVGLTPAKSDFLTTAIHEIGHLLGIGEAPSWFELVESTANGYVFNGAASMAEYGGPVPLDQYASHLALGIQSNVNGVPQSLLMDPSTPRGVRELPTALDMAVFCDIGWQVVPEPGTFALAILGGAGGWALTRRNRRRS